MIPKALSYLQHIQQPDGSFTAWAGSDPAAFITERKQPTAFQTMLIADCLVCASAASDQVRMAARFIRRNANSDGSWNYWQQAYAQQTTMPYPNDLDDTACAIALLARCDSDLMNAEQWGKFARLLVSAELAVGGPYNTWLINHEQFPAWHQTDIAVNANIGYALAQQGVTPAGLRSFIETAIAGNNYTSEFYVTEVPVVYFISRWYAGKQQAALQHKIQSLLRAVANTSPLHTALLLAAAHHQGIVVPQQAQLKKYLQATQLADGSWPAAALYVDPRYHGQQFYGGSPALTTAFVVQALSLLQKPPITVVPRARRISLQYQSTSDIPDTMVRRRYRKAVRRVLASAYGEQIAGAASLAASAGNYQVKKQTLRTLNAASLHGWIAYTLYDDILDGEAAAAELCVANIALRRSFEAFLQATGCAEYQTYVRKVFTIMDCANAWELQRARAVVTPQGIKYKQLPDYSQYGQLAERSLGHSLAAVAVMQLQYGSLQAPEVQSLMRYFKHFLIARQLNDDAHDWEDDLRAGQLTAVVAQLLRDYDCASGVVSFEDDMANLQSTFWQQTINTISADIQRHCLAAQEALAEIPDIAAGSIFSQWLNRLEASAERAIAGRNDALQFIKAYEASNG